MFKPTGIFVICLGVLLTAPVLATGEEAPQLPAWQVLEFEETAFWATAQSRLEILPDEVDEQFWDLEVVSSVVNNSEQIDVVFDPANGRAHRRSRLSRGSGQRMKSYQYGEDSLERERRDQPADPGVPPQKWPVSSTKTIAYPPAAARAVVTSPYLLLFLALQLQAQGPDKSLEALVHTDQNFYRARLTSGRGIPIEVNYEVDGRDEVSGERDTRAVAVHVHPEGALADNDDFSFMGLQGDIILFFDSESGLPLQVRGVAPRIGETGINLRAVTMRHADK